MKNIPISGIVAIAFGILIFLLPNLIAYLVALFLVLHGILIITANGKK